MHRRRSAAHELYPPLTSIFESSSNSGDAMSALLDRWLAEHLSAADRPPSPANAPSTFGSASSTIMPRNVPAAGATFPAAAAARPRSVTHTECGFGCSDPSGPVSLLCDPIATAGAHPVARRRDSCVSLASTISTASSIISSSSDQSSYAYIFDSARPSTHGTPRQRRHCRALGSARTLAGLLCDTGPLLFGPMTAAQPATRQLDRHDALPPTERSALLGAPEGPAGDGPGDNGDRTPTPRLVVRETKSILRMAGHLLASGVLQSLISMSQVASSGRLGRDELAAIGLAHMVVILTGYPVIFGVLGCLETLASQAATSSRPQLVGAYFVRAVQTLWALGLALGAMWFTAEPMLAAIVHGAGADTAALAATYLRWYLVPFMVFATGLLARQVLCAQGIAYPLPFLTLLGALVTVGAQYLFAFSPYFQLGIRGVALGSGTGYLAMLAATLWLVCRHDLPRIWGGFSVRAPVKPFVALLPPCMLLALLSSGSGELVTMAATQLGPAALSVQAVAGALSRMFSILFSSIGIAALNRVGNLIGQRSPRAASVAAYTALCVALAAVATGAAAVVCAPEWWAAIFTTDAQVIRAAAELAPVVALAFGAQALALVGSQLLAAQGRQALAARIKFVALYAIGVPLGCYLMLARDYGLAGLWTAMAVGQACTAVAEAAVVLRTNWPWLVNRSTQSMGAGSA
ncbi:ethionine resistance protein [Coemansia biformis]|uniref:Ethionine resistance protein n=1 Tax=Coemansia biformis TaxID=1286918 RepID=A0A9W8CXF2_9FUNG|nr:ethionine resistance protein [Coemansia biformis]